MRGRKDCSLFAGWLTLWVLLCLLLPGHGFAGQRELKTENSEKLDAVLLLDASGSMLATDPKRLRDDGVRVFIRSLRAEDRLGMVQFSRDASVLRALQPVNKEHESEVEADLAKVENTGTYTDILAGLKLAVSMLEENHRDDAQQIVVLLSDGKMEPDPAIASASTRTDEMLNGLLPELKAKGIKVYTVAFSAQADKELLASIALASEAVSWYSPDADSLHKSYTELFLAVKKPQMLPLTNKGFRIDEAVQEATFYVSRNDKEEVEILSPSGTKSTATNKGPDVKWFRGEKFDVVTIATPAVGFWQITGITPEEGFATILTNLKLQSEWPISLNAETAELLQARLYENEKPVALPEMSGVTKYGFQITPTDQVATPIMRDFLHDDGKLGDKIAGDGIFSASITIDTPGEYKMRVVAQSQTFTRNQQISFRVKPPLIRLFTVAREVEANAVKVAPVAASGEGEGGGHAGGEEDAPPEAQSHDEEASSHGGGAGEAAHAGATSEATPSSGFLATESTIEYFVVELSDEAAQLKNIEVKLLAVGKDHKIYHLILKRVDDRFIRYEAPVALLPSDEEYELRAEIRGIGRAKRTVRGQSKVLKYTRKRREGDPEVRIVVAEKEVEPEGFPFVALLLVLLTNGVSGFLGVTFLKRAQRSLVLAAPDVGDVSSISALIEELQTRVNVVDVDLNDELFTNPNFQVPTAPAGLASSAAPGETEAGAAGADPTAETPATEASAEPEAPDGTEGKET